MVSENPSYYPPEHYLAAKQERQRPLEVWVKVPLTAQDAADLFRGFVKAGWGGAFMPGDTEGGMQKIVLLRTGLR